MGPPSSSKGRRNAASQPKGRGKGTWMEATASRLAEAGGVRDIGTREWPVPHDTQMATIDRMDGLERGRRQSAGVFSEEELPEGSIPHVISPAVVYQATVDTHRRSTGLVASGFEPQRHAFYVLGRPVQVIKKI